MRNSNILSGKDSWTVIEETIEAAMDNETPIGRVKSPRKLDVPVCLECRSHDMIDEFCDRLKSYELKRHACKRCLTEGVTVYDVENENIFTTGTVQTVDALSEEYDDVLNIVQ